MKPSYEELRPLAAEHGQDHLFQYWGELDASQRRVLLEDVALIDFPSVSRLAGEAPPGVAPELDITKIKAPVVYPADSGARLQSLYDEALRKGESLLAANKVAATVVAGGQGTRLGFEGPKGTVPISPVKGKTLFRLFAESIRATCVRYGCRLPWYVMTSAATDEPTRRYFQDNDCLGLDRSEVRFFQQGVMPALDQQGRILLSEKHRVALSPNGHGGTLVAMRDAGVLDDLRRRGIETLSYFQVDNPLVSPADPLFIGLHKLAEAQVSSIAVPKADDLEKVGNFVQIDGKLHVIEYSDLPDDLARARNPDGSRMLDAGNVAIHLFCPSFVEQLTRGGKLHLPWHVANKKVPCVDLETGCVVQPDKPNARKFEMFIFDAIPLADRSIVLEQPRAQCFSPIKNTKGIDSMETARRDMILRAMSWLEQAGATCPRTDTGEPAAKVEISPLRALDAGQLKERLTTSPAIDPGDELYLD